MGGGLGMFGSLLMGHYNEYGKSFTKDMAGPSLATADDLAKLLATMFDFNSKGHKQSWHTRMTKQAMQFGTNHIIPSLMVTHNVVMKHFYSSLLADMDPSIVDKAKKKQDNDNIQVLPFNS